MRRLCVTQTATPYLLRVCRSVDVFCRLVLLLVIASLAATAQAATAAKRRYELPPGDAAVTLRQFAEQSGEQVVYVVTKVRGVATHAVRGEFTAAEVLERMVRGTALVVVRDEKTGALAVNRPAPAPEARPPGSSAPSSMHNQPSPPTSPRAKTLAFLATWFAVLAAPADAQTASASAPAAGPTEAIVLSPFTVSSEKDTGYAATATLAGTRIRTELKDVGTSITVVTSEFLKDTGATNTRGLLTYVTGSEVGGPAGNFSGTAVGQFTGENLGSTAPTRVRGLAAASEARNFYATSIPLDSYNLDRIEINRGANAILFGTGSPAGIINSGLKQAQMRNAYSVEARYGSYDSLRGSFDLNHQIVPSELALRVNGLDQRQRYQQEYAFEDDRRLFGALTYDPKWARTRNDRLSGTVFRANAERGALDSRRPRILPPLDSMTGWFNPWFNGYAPKFTWDAGNQRTTTVVNGVNLFNISPALMTSNPIFRNLSVWFDDPGSGTPGTGSTFNGAAVVGRQGVISNMPVPNTPLGTAFFASAGDNIQAANRTPGLIDPGFYLKPSLTDLSVFDYRRRLIEGPNRSEYANFEAYNVALEQRFLGDRAGFELAFDRQRFNSGGSTLVGGASDFRMDINTTFIDGSPNPNFGRPFLGSSWTSSFSRNESKTGRATVFYRLDAADFTSPRLARWLGKLNFTGLHEERKGRSLSLSGDRFDPGLDYIYGNNNLITDFNGGKLGQLSYIGPSLAGATTARGAGIVGLRTLQLPSASVGKTFQLRNQTANGTFVTTPISLIEDSLVPSQLVTGANKSGTNARAQAAVIQGKLLHDTLVATLGWRRDAVDAFAAAAPNRGARNNLVVDESVWVFPSKPSSSASDETQSRSFVFHVPAPLVRRLPVASSFSLRYNTSQNFAPGGTRYDSNGASLPSPSGTTKDVGFALGLASDRFTLGATWYETKQINVTASGIGGLTQNIVDNWRTFTNITNLGQNPGSAQVVAPPQALLDLYSFTVTNGSASFIGRPDIVLTQDVVSKGVEFEVVANLTRQWRLMFNAARQSASRSNTGGVFRELFFERKIGGQTLFENWSGPAGQAAKISEGGATLASQSVPGIANPYNLQARQDGGPAQELRKWRANLVSNYTFSRESRLHGFGVGSGVRWQDKVAIGFPNITANNIRVPDVSRPFYGPRELNVDAWIRYERRILGDKVKLNVQLNVFNVVNDDALIPMGTQPTGEIAVFRIPASRRYEVNTRFEF